jgi:AcrR family transcriptional regulator
MEDQPKNRWTAASPASPWPRFRIGGFVGTSIADLAGALGVSKAAIYYHYRSKDALLHRLIDPLLDAIDALHPRPHHPGHFSPDTATARGAYLAALITHRDIVPLITTDVAALNHPRSVHACAPRTNSYSPC